MKMLAAVLLLTIAIPRTAPGQRCCNAVDKAFLAVSTTAISIDWLQTVDGIRSGLRESNPLLGPHPSLGKANLLIATGVLANAGVALINQRELRWFIWASVILLEAEAIRTNHASGLRLNFRF